MLKDSEELPVTGPLALTNKSHLDFVFPSALKHFRRHLLPVAAGCNVCCILQCSSDGGVWSPVRRPDKRAIVNTLVSQFQDFVSVV